MNRLCHMVEDEFKAYTSEVKLHSNFDSSILKSGTEYSEDISEQILNIYSEYKSVREECVREKNDYKISREDFSLKIKEIKKYYKEKCETICSNNKMLCDIIVDNLYNKSAGRVFAWDVCADQMIENLLDKNGHRIKYLEQDDNGIIESNGYSFVEKYIENI